MNILMKMKKYTIDDIFAKKLADYRQEPSQQAFEKFQTRLAEKQQKRRGGFFLINRNWAYYAAAAAIVAALMIGISSQQNSTDTPVLASKNILPKTTTQHYVSKQNTSNQLATIKNLSTDSFNNPLKTVKILPIIITEKSMAKVKPQPKVMESAIIDDSPAEQNSVALNPIFETFIIDNVEPKQIKTLETSNLAIDESIVLILEPEQIEEIIPAINSDSPTSLEEAKRVGAEKEESAKSFIAKLYGEYKHFKYGEKVDLKKIGMKDALAKVDENLFKEEREEVIGFLQRRVGRLQKKD